MADLNDKLKRLMAGRRLMTGAQLRRQREESEQLRRTGAFEIDACVPGQVAGDASGGFYLARTDFPLDTVHGGWPLGAILDVNPEQVAFSACDPELRAFEPGTAVFIDTETSGLAGGTGTVTFLVGAGYFAEADTGEGLVFRLEQCFMRDFDDEEPMLRYLDGLFRRAETIVSFNGKTFDVPLLRTRFLFNRIPFRLDGAMHYDLIHAVRRIWKLRLADCSLANVERAVLDVRRQGDVPSAEIPELWFNYLRTRDARALPRVFYHHKMDILSLVALAAMVSRRLEVPHGEGFDYAEDRLSVIRLHYRQKRFAETVTYARKLLESETEHPVRRHVMELYVLACKRLRDWEQMAQVCAMMSAEFPYDVLPRIELAKHYEHRVKDLAKAIEICLEATQFIGPAGPDEWPMSELLHRIDRMQRKLAQKPQRGMSE